MRKEGFEGLSIGTVASSVGMSKSGVFAHFGSREDLQLAVLDAAAQRFTEQVFLPAIREPRGLPRLERDRPPLDEMAAQRAGRLPDGQRRDRIRRSARRDPRARDLLPDAPAQGARARDRHGRRNGELRADTDPAQLAFEIFGIELAMHHDSRLFGFDDAIARSERALDRLITSYRV